MRLAKHKRWWAGYTVVTRGHELVDICAPPKFKASYTSLENRDILTLVPISVPSQDCL